MTKINSNPIIHSIQESKTEYNLQDEILDPISQDEIFELIRTIQDPEHPNTLEQLNVVQPELISIQPCLVSVRFTPTIPHCSMATLIGLCIRVKLMRSLSPKFKIDIKVTEGTHQSELAVNKQLNDKERVCAALENNPLLEIVNQCILSNQE